MKKFVLVVLLSVFGFAGVLTVSCEFHGGSNIKGIDNDSMSMVFKYDDVSKKSYIEGNNGLGNAQMIPTGADRLLHFLELTDSGNLMLMSVDVEKKGINAMYSRHIKILTSIFPSQRYGHCDTSYSKSPEIKVKSNMPSKDDLINIAIKLNLIERMKNLPELDKKYIRDTLKGKFLTNPSIPEGIKNETMMITGEILTELVNFMGFKTKGISSNATSKSVDVSDLVFEKENKKKGK